MRKYLKMIPIFYGAVTLFPLSFVVGNDIIQIIFIVIALVAFIIATLLSLTIRRCGHGFVTQWKYGLFFPFVISPCPKCGRTETY